MDQTTDAKVQRVFSFWDEDGNGYWSFEEAAKVKRDTENATLDEQEWHEICDWLQADKAKGLNIDQVKKLYEFSGLEAVEADYVVAEADLKRAQHASPTCPPSPASDSVRVRENTYDKAVRRALDNVEEVESRYGSTFYNQNNRRFSQSANRPGRDQDSRGLTSPCSGSHLQHTRCFDCSLSLEDREVSFADGRTGARVRFFTLGEELLVAPSEHHSPTHVRTLNYDDEGCVSVLDGKGAQHPSIVLPKAERGYLKHKLAVLADTCAVLHNIPPSDEISALRNRVMDLEESLSQALNTVRRLESEKAQPLEQQEQQKQQRQDIANGATPQASSLTYVSDVRPAVFDSAPSTPAGVNLATNEALLASISAHLLPHHQRRRTPLSPPSPAEKESARDSRDRLPATTNGAGDGRSDASTLSATLALGTPIDMQGGRMAQGPRARLKQLQLQQCNTDLQSEMQKVVGTADLLLSVLKSGGASGVKNCKQRFASSAAPNNGEVAGTALQACRLAAVNGWDDVGAQVWAAGAGASTPSPGRGFRGEQGELRPEHPFPALPDLGSPAREAAWIVCSPQLVAASYLVPEEGCPLCVAQASVQPLFSAGNDAPVALHRLQGLGFAACGPSFPSLYRPLLLLASAAAQLVTIHNTFLGGPAVVRTVPLPPCPVPVLPDEDVHKEWDEIVAAL